MATQYIKKYLSCKPGIDKDGTRFDSESYIDGQHVRFYRGKPKKIGGYKIGFTGTTEIVRALSIPPLSLASPTSSEAATVVNKALVFMGRPSSLKSGIIDIYLNTTPLIDRTPVGIVPSVNNTWDFGYYTQASVDSNVNYVIAHLDPNNNNFNGNVEGGVYIGITNDSAPLVPITYVGGDPVIVSGSICTIGQFIIAYGNDGVIVWSDPTDVNAPWPVDNFQEIAPTKIITAAESTGGGVPTGLFWSTNSLLRLSYNVIEGNWNVNVLQQNTPILSKNCVVTVDSVFYWLEINRFVQFTGVINELPNIYNKRFLFDNLNYAQRTKVWGIVIAEWNEIWWFVPLNDSDECNHVIIHNYATKDWYDTALARTCGYVSEIFTYPIMADCNSTRDLSSPPPPGQLPPMVYPLWVHEYGTDQVMFGYSYAIPSYYQTNITSLFDNSPTDDYQVRTRRIEADFKRTGTISVQIQGWAFANSTPIKSDIYVLSPTDYKVDTNFMSRLSSYIFTSNDVGGDYQAGKVLLDFVPGDQRPGS